MNQVALKAQQLQQQQQQQQQPDAKRPQVQDTSVPTPPQPQSQPQSKGSKASGKQGAKKKVQADDQGESQAAAAAQATVAGSRVTAPPAKVTRNRAATEEAWNNLPEWIRKLSDEVEARLPPLRPVPITPEQKKIVDRLLYESLDVLSRMDELVQWYVTMPGYERSFTNMLVVVSLFFFFFAPFPTWL